MKEEVLNMPVGNPSKQTIATRKYEAKAGWVSKTYKMKKEIVEAFKEVCEKNGDSQAGKLMEYMQDYFNNTK